MSTINQHTPGPLSLDVEVLGTNWAVTTEGHPVFAAARGAPERRKPMEANRDLMIAAYNAFDKAARELGVDTTELAEKIDILSLLKTVGSKDSASPANDDALWYVEVCGVKKHITTSRVREDLADIITQHEHHN